MALPSMTFPERPLRVSPPGSGRIANLGTLLMLMGVAYDSDEGRAIARDRGIRAFHGAADAIETTTAYVAFRGLLSSLLGVDDVASAEARGAEGRRPRRPGQAAGPAAGRGSAARRPCRGAARPRQDRPALREFREQPECTRR